MKSHYRKNRDFQMKTATHYVNNHGQHHLPECLQNQELYIQQTILDWEEIEDLGEKEVDEIKHALISLGVDYELDADGLTIVNMDEEVMDEEVFE